MFQLQDLEHVVQQMVDERDGTYKAFVTARLQCAPVGISGAAYLNRWNQPDPVFIFQIISHVIWKARRQNTSQKSRCPISVCCVRFIAT